MDGTRMQALVDKGYAIAAAKVGLLFQVYRTTAATAPIVPANLLATLPATFTADNYGYKKPNGYGKPTWTVLVDGRITQPGDYLVEVTALPGQAARVFFISAQQPLLPIVAVSCNAVLTLKRPHSSAGFGALPYGGDIAAAEDVLATGWPGSVLTKGRGEKGDVQLPDDVRSPWVEVLLPAMPGVTVKFADTLYDANGQRMKVSSAELSDLGWRLLCVVAVT